MIKLPDRLFTILFGMNIATGISNLSKKNSTVMIPSKKRVKTRIILLKVLNRRQLNYFTLSHLISLKNYIRALISLKVIPVQPKESILLENRTSKHLMNIQFDKGV